jgi:hypothetical protein
MIEVSFTSEILNYAHISYFFTDEKYTAKTLKWKEKLIISRH